MSDNWHVTIAKGFYDMRVGELGKIRGVVVQNNEAKNISICVETCPDCPEGKKVTIFPYGYVYVNTSEEVLIL